MSGIFLVLVTGLWAIFLTWFGRSVARRLLAGKWQKPLIVLATFMLLPLPLLDELLGRFQFEQLCDQNSFIYVDSTAINRFIYLTPVSDSDVKGTWVRIVLQPRRFLDRSDGKTIISYTGLVANGGWLVKSLGISEGNVPLTFKGWCKPGDQHSLDSLLKEMNLTLLR